MLCAMFFCDLLLIPLSKNDIMEKKTDEVEYDV